MKLSAVSIESAALQITMLGSPKITWRGEPLLLTRRQVRALLFYLAHEPAPAPRDRLSFLLWPDLPDQTARANLKRLLSTLRSALPDGSLLLADHSVIGLDRARLWCDAAAFEQLAASSDPGSWSQAVELYRGGFLDGFSLPDSPEYGDWQFQVRAQVERFYLAALSSLIDARRAAGDLDAAVDYALRHLAVDDLAEDVHRHLIELYVAKGDRSAAARQFERCALILERDLGVRPLPETRAAYEAATSTRPPRPPIAPRWSILPSLDLPLIGREDAVRTLTDAYHRLQTGGLILIYGEPGVGKSRLMQEFARLSSATVLAGNNPPGAQSIPYTAPGEALRQALSLPGRWQDVRPVWLAEAGRLLPEMTDVFPDLPQPVQVEPAQAQARLFEALARCLLGLAGQGPLLLCLDDLQWADPATLSWLAALPRLLAGSRVCILASCRLADVAVVADVKRAFARPGLLAETILSRLTAADVGDILAQLPQPPGNPQPLAARIHDATGGNAFFVLETLRALLEVGPLADSPDHLPLASTVQAAIERRLESLSPLGRQVLETAAVLTPDLEFDLLAQTAGHADLEVAQGLDELAGRQLVVGEELRRFSHDLVRQVAYDAISPWRRRILHRRAAEALDTPRRRRAELAWAAMAGHYALAGDTADALRCFEQAALAAQRLYAHQEAIGYGERAIDLCRDEPPPPGLPARLYQLMGDSQMARGQHEAAERAFATALDLTGANDRLTRAVLHHKVAASYRARLLLAEAESASDRALATMGPPAGGWPVQWQHVWLEHQLSRMDILYFKGDLDRLAELIDAIEPTVESVGAPVHRADFAKGLMELSLRREHFALSAQTVARSDALLAAARATDDLARIAWAEFGRGFTLLLSNRATEAAAPLLAGLKQAQEGGLAYTEVLCLTYLACLYRLLGDAAEARRHAERSLAASAQVDMPIYRAMAHANLAVLHGRDGRADAAQIEAERALTLWGDYPYPFRWLGNWVLLAVHAARGDLEEGVQQARAILHPAQRRQPGDLPVVLAAAVRAWENGKPDETMAALQQAIELAQAEGYL